MKKTEAMKLNKDFKRLYYRGKSFAGKYIVVYTLRNGRKVNRLGLTCGKTIGKAVVRNRAKRLMRESYRLSESNIKAGNDIVIVARSRAVYAKCPTIKRELEYAVKKLGLYEESEENSSLPKGIQ